MWIVETHDDDDDEEEEEEEEEQWKYQHFLVVVTLPDNRWDKQ